MPQKEVIFGMMGVTVILISLAIVSLATANWVHTETIYQSSLGLWEYCDAGKCKPFPFKGESIMWSNTMTSLWGEVLASDTI